MATTLRLAPLFTNHMVMQQDQTTRFFGYTEPDQEVTVTISMGGSEDTIETGIADEDGYFLIESTSFLAPTIVTVSVKSGTDEIILRDVQFGDVFLIAGQSNASFKMAQDDEFDHNKTMPMMNLRFVNMPEVQTTEENSWQIVDEENIGDVTAMGYYIAKKIRQYDEYTPIGIVLCAKGGTAAASWVSEKTLMHDETLKAAYVDTKIPKIVDTANLFESMLKNVGPYRFKMMTWYQGESDADIDTKHYGLLLKKLIREWRKTLKQNKLPTYIIQLPQYNGKVADSWAEIREAQQQFASTENRVYLVTAMDQGSADNIHPSSKRELGYRIVELYSNEGKFEDMQTSPQLSEISADVKQMRLNFSNCEQLETIYPIDLKWIMPGNVLKPAVIDLGTNDIKIKLEEESLGLQYAYANVTSAGLWNENHVPISPFRIYFD
ncbi:sialate O-acetylesterase [Dellaglioa sp. L3N]